MDLTYITSYFGNINKIKNKFYSTDNIKKKYSLVKNDSSEEMYILKNPLCVISKVDFTVKKDELSEIDIEIYNDINNIPEQIFSGRFNYFDILGKYIFQKYKASKVEKPIVENYSYIKDGLNSVFIKYDISNFIENGCKKHQLLDNLLDNTECSIFLDLFTSSNWKKTLSFPAKYTQYYEYQPLIYASNYNFENVFQLNDTDWCQLGIYKNYINLYLGKSFFKKLQDISIYVDGTTYLYIDNYYKYDYTISNTFDITYNILNFLLVENDFSLFYIPFSFSIVKTESGDQSYINNFKTYVYLNTPPKFCNIYYDSSFGEQKFKNLNDNKEFLPVQNLYFIKNNSKTLFIDYEIRGLNKVLFNKVKSDLLETENYLNNFFKNYLLGRNITRFFDSNLQGGCFSKYYVGEYSYDFHYIDSPYFCKLSQYNNHTYNGDYQLQDIDLFSKGCSFHDRAVYLYNDSTFGLSLYSIDEDYLKAVYKWDQKKYCYNLYFANINYNNISYVDKYDHDNIILNNVLFNKKNFNFSFYDEIIFEDGIQIDNTYFIVQTSDGLFYFLLNVFDDSIFPLGISGSNLERAFIYDKSLIYFSTFVDGTFSLKIFNFDSSSINSIFSIVDYNEALKRDDIVYYSIDLFSKINDSTFLVYESVGYSNKIYFNFYLINIDTKIIEKIYSFNDDFQIYKDHKKVFFNDEKYIYMVISSSHTNKSLLFKINKKSNNISVNKIYDKCLITIFKNFIKNKFSYNIKLSPKIVKDDLISNVSIYSIPIFITPLSIENGTYQIDGNENFFDINNFKEEKIFKYNLETTEKYIDKDIIHNDNIDNIKNYNRQKYDFYENGIIKKFIKENNFKYKIKNLNLTLNGIYNFKPTNINIQKFFKLEKYDSSTLFSIDRDAENIVICNQKQEMYDIQYYSSDYGLSEYRINSNSEIANFTYDKQIDSNKFFFMRIDGDIGYLYQVDIYNKYRRKNSILPNENPIKYTRFYYNKEYVTPPFFNKNKYVFNQLIESDVNIENKLHSPFIFFNRPNTLQFKYVKKYNDNINWLCYNAELPYNFRRDGYFFIEFSGFTFDNKKYGSIYNTLGVQRTDKYNIKKIFIKDNLLYFIYDKTEIYDIIFRVYKYNERADSFEGYSTYSYDNSLTTFIFNDITTTGKILETFDYTIDFSNFLIDFSDSTFYVDYTTNYAHGLFLRIKDNNMAIIEMAMYDKYNSFSQNEKSEIYQLFIPSAQKILLKEQYDSTILLISPEFNILTVLNFDYNNCELNLIEEYKDFTELKQFKYYNIIYYDDTIIQFYSDLYKKIKCFNYRSKEILNEYNNINIVYRENINKKQYIYYDIYYNNIPIRYKGIISGDSTKIENIKNIDFVSQSDISNITYHIFTDYSIYYDDNLIKIYDNSTIEYTLPQIYSINKIYWICDKNDYYILKLKCYLKNSLSYKDFLLKISKNNINLIVFNDNTYSVDNYCNVQYGDKNVSKKERLLYWCDLLFNNVNEIIKVDYNNIVLTNKYNNLTYIYTFDKTTICISEVAELPIVRALINYNCYCNDIIQYNRQPLKNNEIFINNVCDIYSFIDSSKNLQIFLNNISKINKDIPINGQSIFIPNKNSTIVYDTSNYIIEKKVVPFKLPIKNINILPNTYVNKENINNIYFSENIKNYLKYSNVFDDFTKSTLSYPYYYKILSQYLQDSIDCTIYNKNLIIFNQVCALSKNSRNFEYTFRYDKNEICNIKIDYENQSTESYMYNQQMNENYNNLEQIHVPNDNTSYVLLSIDSPRFGIISLRPQSSKYYTYAFGDVFEDSSYTTVLFQNPIYVIDIYLKGNDITNIYNDLTLINNNNIDYSFYVIDNTYIIDVQNQVTKLVHSKKISKNNIQINTNYFNYNDSPYSPITYTLNILNRETKLDEYKSYSPFIKKYYYPYGYKYEPYQDDTLFIYYWISSSKCDMLIPYPMMVQYRKNEFTNIEIKQSLNIDTSSLYYDLSYYTNYYDNVDCIGVQIPEYSIFYQKDFSNFNEFKEKCHDVTINEFNEIVFNKFQKSTVNYKNIQIINTDETDSLFILFNSNVFLKYAKYFLISSQLSQYIFITQLSLYKELYDKMYYFYDDIVNFYIYIRPYIHKKYNITYIKNKNKSFNIWLHNENGKVHCIVDSTLCKYSDYSSKNIIDNYKLYDCSKYLLISPNKDDYVKIKIPSYHICDKLDFSFLNTNDTISMVNFIEDLNIDNLNICNLIDNFSRDISSNNEYKIISIYNFNNNFFDTTFFNLFQYLQIDITNYSTFPIKVMLYIENENIYDTILVDVNNIKENIYNNISFLNLKKIIIESSINLVKPEKYNTIINIKQMRFSDKTFYISKHDFQIISIESSTVEDSNIYYFGNILIQGNKNNNIISGLHKTTINSGVKNEQI